MDNARRAQRAAEEAADRLMAATEFLDKNPMFYSQKQDRYFVKTSSGRWEDVKPSSMHNRYFLWREDSNFGDVITGLMEQEGLMYTNITYSFHETPSDIRNLMDRSGWVQPSNEQHHWAFDCLVQSLGGGKAENITHLERWIAYKYSHPEAFRLPALLIHGEGAVGKNLMVNTVLRTLFDGQTAIAVGDNVIGQFNSVIEGKTIIMINESVSHKADVSKLKDLLQSETIWINRKGIPQFEVENTSSFFIGSNEEEGGIYLDRSEADRRYSVFKCPAGKTLNHWIAQYLKTEIDDARLWMETTGGKIMADRVEVAKWIGHLLAKYEGQDMPVALHGEDYQALMGVQRPIEDKLFESIMANPEFNFTHIKVMTLYRGYRAMCAERGSKPTLWESKFSSRATAYATAHGLIHARKRQRGEDNKVALIYHPDCHKIETNNDTDFVEYGPDGRDRWKGPELY